MNKFYALLAFAFLLVQTDCTNAQAVWNGPLTTFTKANFADQTLEENQDRLTDNVWITRGSNGGLINIVNETMAGGTGTNGDVFPSDTEWAYGTTENFGSLTFQGLSPLIGENFQNIVDGQDMVLHLITDDIYIDIKFLSWTSGSQNGGGFSYERSTELVSSTSELEKAPEISVYPNPATDLIFVSGIEFDQTYTLYSLIGEKVMKGIASNDSPIDITQLNQGIYFLKLESGDITRILKD